MTAVFADTFFFLAWLNPHDRAHAAAREFRKQRRELITTGFIMMELGDGLSAPPHRAHFALLYASIRRDADVEFVAADQVLLDAGLELFEARPDKAWSVTDCTSFALMEQRGIREALTGDHHFEQAGFIALLRQ